MGKPPFETQSLKDTYTRIKKNEYHYHIPSRIGPLARNLIQHLLQHEPVRRPSAGEILKDDFMTMGLLPTRLPVSCLTMAPRFDTEMNTSLIARRTPLTEVNLQPGTGVPTLERKDSNRDRGGAPSDCYLSELHKQLGQLVASKPGDRGGALAEDECVDPKSQSMTWVSKWVDYSDKYGFGYSLNEDSIRVVFNDFTKLLLKIERKKKKINKRRKKEENRTKKRKKKSEKMNKEMNKNSNWCCRKTIIIDHAVSTQSIL